MGYQRRGDQRKDDARKQHTFQVEPLLMIVHSTLFPTYKLYIRIEIGTNWQFVHISQPGICTKTR